MIHRQWHKIMDDRVQKVRRGRDIQCRDMRVSRDANEYFQCAYHSDRRWMHLIEDISTNGYVKIIFAISTFLEKNLQNKKKSKRIHYKIEEIKV